MGLFIQIFSKFYPHREEEIVKIKHQTAISLNVKRVQKFFFSKICFSNYFFVEHFLFFILFLRGGSTSKTQKMDPNQ